MTITEDSAAITAYGGIFSGGLRGHLSQDSYGGGVTIGVGKKGTVGPFGYRAQITGAFDIDVKTTEDGTTIKTVTSAFRGVAATTIKGYGDTSPNALNRVI